jgi:hypothetical protein
MDVMIGSWASVNCFDLNFGFGVGKPEAVRRPQFAPFECLIFFAEDAGWGDYCCISLREEDMERLAVDEEFGKFAKFIP